MSSSFFPHLHQASRGGKVIRSKIPWSDEEIEELRRLWETNKEAMGKTAPRMFYTIYQLECVVRFYLEKTLENQYERTFFCFIKLVDKCNKFRIYLCIELHLIIKERIFRKLEFFFMFFFIIVVLVGLIKREIIKFLMNHKKN
jgi:hypothetical protein